MVRAADAYHALEDARSAWEASRHENAAAEDRVADLEQAVETGDVVTLGDLLALARLNADLAPATGGVIAETLAANLVKGVSLLFGVLGDITLDGAPSPV